MHNRIGAAVPRGCSPRHPLNRGTRKKATDPAAPCCGHAHHLAKFLGLRTGSMVDGSVLTDDEIKEGKSLPVQHGCVIAARDIEHVERAV